MNRQQSPRDGAPVLCVYFFDQLDAHVAALNEGWRNRIESSVAPWEPVKRSEASVYSLLCFFRTWSAGSAHSGTCTVVGGLISNGVLRSLCSKQKFGHCHSSELSVV